MGTVFPAPDALIGSKLPGPLSSHGLAESAAELQRQKAIALAAKFVSAERALALVQPGSRVYLGTGCAAPRTLLAALEAMQPRPGRPRVRQLPDHGGAAAVDGRTDHPLPASAVLRRQRRARPGCQPWPARLRADLPRRGAAAAGDRPAADRRRDRAGLAARRARLRQPRRVGRPRAGGAGGGAPARDRRGQPGDAAHPRRQLRALDRFDALVAGRHAGHRVPPSADRAETAEHGRPLHRRHHRRRLDAADRAGPRPQRGAAASARTAATSASTATSSPTASSTWSRPAWSPGGARRSTATASSPATASARGGSTTSSTTIRTSCSCRSTRSAARRRSPPKSRMVSITQAFAVDLTGQVCVDQFEGEFYGGVSTRRPSSAAPRARPAASRSSA